MSSLACPSCGARLTAPPTPRPRRGRCPRCGHRVRVPATPPPGETPPDGTAVVNNLSAEGRALCQRVRAAASEKGRRWVARYIGRAAAADRGRIAEAVRALRVIHARLNQGRLDPKRERGLVRRLPAAARREVARLLGTPAGDWAPVPDGPTLREAFDHLRTAAGGSRPAGA